MPPISILDLSPAAAGRGEAAALRETVDAARLADRLGYHRYWLAEHHGGVMLASVAPEIMIGHIASATERIRVGSGGMMLPNHTPLHVAEQFKVLEALHPGRIDLGIGRAPGTDQLTALALRGSRDGGNVELPEQLGQLQGFSGDREWPDGHPFRSVVAAPADVDLPPVFLLGSSDYSAQVAAAGGFGFAFAAHINPEAAVDVLRMYRDRFVASPGFAEPCAILAHQVICAETDERARQLAAPMRVAFRRLRSGEPGPIPSIEDALAEDRPFGADRASGPRARVVAGAPESVRSWLDQLLTDSGADELMVTTNTHDPADRDRSLELLASAYHLS